MNDWIIVAEKKNDICKHAVQTVLKAVRNYCSSPVSVRSFRGVSGKDLTESNPIVIACEKNNSIAALLTEKGVVRVPEKQESYSVYVGKNIFNAKKQMVAIIGRDKVGMLYGCMDFCNRYCGKELVTVENNNLIFVDDFAWELFEKPLRKWEVNESPAIPTRAIWTWGRVIYDYRRFFENMAKIRLNEIVIWNDFVPLNAKEIIARAHSLGIKVVWGFAWGWGVNCKTELQKLIAKGTMNDLKKSVLYVYETQYADTGADGIYFQSFTEMADETVDGRNIAETVTDFVNDVAGELLERYPHLQIQFGLHATSVKNQLEYLKKLDGRVRIVWEDCGAFPYAYKADQIENFDETVELTKKLMRLRGADEPFGAVLKGMVNLDWIHFRHETESTTLGERSRAFVRQRQKLKNPIWKIVQANWLKNAKYAKTLIFEIAERGNDPVLQVLAEDGMFENDIMYPVALYADFMWNPYRNTDEILETVAKYPCVKFANI